ncbi:MAG: hypothetical protein KAS63_06950 [Candidatus Heimdallarchaeota archaeon]|nr:hypothetical protein [Candidatus Heimdallarchaeota archaeon]MCK4955083.1 hypothetical protein [Candidatus Heimdallarchaeota archaeon]
MKLKFKWLIKNSIIIDATVAKVWEVISQPGNLNLCHPFCKENTVRKWPGKDSEDTIIYYSGWEVERNFFEWEIEKGYKLMIGRKGGRKTEVQWEIKESEKTREGERAILSISLKVPNLQHIPVIFRWIPHFLFLKPKMKKYLNSVVRGFEYYITTGKPIKRNQFGSHPWFSPKMN